jgi:glucosylceramidase
MDMSVSTTRRDFMKLSAAGLATLAQPFPALAQTPGPITVQQTAGTKRFATEPTLHWQAASAGETTADVITVDPSKMYQDVLGFGAAMTDAATYMINQLSPQARERLLHELFDRDELGINIVRICVGASDFSTELFSYDEGEPDPELTRFSIEHDRAYVIPELLAARKICPELFILASPWSPPGWMKNGGSMLGGDMKPKYFAVYAQYLVKYLQAYRAAGIPIQAITSQNEVDTEQAERMPACAFAQEHEVIFDGRHLGPALQAASLDTRIWLLDHNWNLWGRVYNTLEDPEVYKYVEGVAWHPYVGHPTAMTRIHDAYPTKSQYWTEGQFATATRSAFVRTAATPGPMTQTLQAPQATPGPMTQLPATPNGQNNAGVMDLTPLHHEMAPDAAIAAGGVGGAMGLRNWVRCVIDWNVALDENGNPNIGPFVHGHGTVTINSRTKEITRNPNYWVIKHYNHAARRGARVIDSQGELEKVAHVAFLNPDGRKCVVISNTGEERTVEVRVAGASARVVLPSKSVTNLNWS